MKDNRRLLVLALGNFAMGTDGFVVAGVLPEITRSFHVGIGAAGQMTTVFALTYALLAPTIATLAANVPRKRLLLAALGLFVIANLGTALVPTFGLALATRALAGVAAAMFSPTATGSATVIVPRERMGFALSVVVSGMTISTALGAPLGTVIGGLGNWRYTMVFVALLAFLSFLGVLAFLSEIPMLPAISLAKRLAPVADMRVALTLCTTMLFFTAAFTIYTYFAVVFGRAIGGNATVFGGLLAIWGMAGIFSNLVGGRLIDSIGSRRVLNTLLAFVLVDFALLYWSGPHLWTAVAAIIIWGCCGWGTLVPLQHRLVSIAPPIAPILLGLNTSAIYLGTTAAGIIGAAGIQVLGAQYLGYIAALFVGAAMVVAEFAARRIATGDETKASTESPMNPLGATPDQAKA